MTEHTKGPWVSRRINETDASWAVIGQGPIGDVIIAGYIKDEYTANLIAYAPDMLEALKEIISINDEPLGVFRKRGGTRRGLSIAAARAIISKAEGK